MSETVELTLDDWGACVNATIALMADAYKRDDVADALYLGILFGDLAPVESDKTLARVPPELLAPLRHYRAAPHVESEPPTLADALPTVQALYDEWHRA